MLYFPLENLFQQSFLSQPPLSRQKIIRRWSNIDYAGFSHALEASGLNRPIPDSATTDDLFDSNEAVKRDLADQYAPSSVTRCQKIAVCFDAERRMMRHQSRLLEGRYRRTHFSQTIGNFKFSEDWRDDFDDCGVIDCTAEIDNCMSSNRLKLNSDSSSGLGVDFNFRKWALLSFNSVLRQLQTHFDNLILFLSGF